MELVNPPEGFGAVYPDGQIVETDVGFGILKSTHCAFVEVVRDYQARVFESIADLMSDAGIRPQPANGRISVVVLHEPRPLSRTEDGFLSPGDQGSGASRSRPPAATNSSSRPTTRW